LRQFKQLLKRSRELADFSDRYKDDLLLKLGELEKNIKDTLENSKEKGSTFIEIVFIICIALIALGFVGTMIYMIIEGYEIPPGLQSTISSIIGFFFGVTTATIISKRLTGEKTEHDIIDSIKQEISNTLRNELLEKIDKIIQIADKILKESRKNISKK